ncbi:hypothetical protein D3C73_1308360 [compost metagenome]
MRARTDPRHLRAAQGVVHLRRRQGRRVRDDIGVAGGFEDRAGARVDVLEQDDFCHDCQGVVRKRFIYCGAFLLQCKE